MARVLSGIQPSGTLHIGNYFAMMKRMIEFQEEHELFCFIVNYHALTSTTNADMLRKNTLDSTSSPAASIRTNASSSARAMCRSTASFPGSSAR